MSEEVYPGPFITFEGLDGSGKSSVVHYLQRTGSIGVENAAAYTAEPSRLWTGYDVVRPMIEGRKPTTPVSTFMAFMADRHLHIQENVLPAIEEGRTVISDRYSDSTRVYQSHALSESGYFGTRDEALEWIEHCMEPWETIPDLTVYLDVTVDTALARCGRGDDYEKEDFLWAVYEGYHDYIVGRDRVVVVNGEQSFPNVMADVLNEVSHLL